jgi:hypothetical protein
MGKYLAYAVDFFFLYLFPALAPLMSVEYLGGPSSSLVEPSSPPPPLVCS